jgi:septal ring factor EnvC (AmiA/AmiB activator)
MASQSGRMLAAAQLRQLEAERSRLRHELARAEHAFDSVSKELAECGAARNALRNELEHSKAEAVSLRNLLDTETARRHAIEASRSWRWTRFLRRVMDAGARRP